MTSLSLPITSIAVAGITALMMFISFKIIGVRRKQKISVGDGGDDYLFALRSAQANLTENGPLGVLLIIVCELQGLWWPLLAVLALALLAGRTMHAYAFAQQSIVMKFRIWGMYLTIFPMVGLAFAALVLGVLP